MRRHAEVSRPAGFLQGRIMPSINSISADKLVRLIGTPHCPALIDVRNDNDFAADPRFVPGSARIRSDQVENWSSEFQGRRVVVICNHGHNLSHGVAAHLRVGGVEAEILEGGFNGWLGSKLPLVPADKLPKRNSTGQTVWVTRERPKVDRIACPWLIRRFVDPKAVFLFVAAAEVVGVGEHFNAAPFDIEDVYWSHRSEKCTFDVMIEELGLTSAPLTRLSAIVRGADTGRLDLAPEVPGFLAASLGISRMYTDDLAQLEAGLALYDAFYRWARDATGETHNWPTNKPGTEK